MDVKVTAALSILSVKRNHHMPFNWGHMKNKTHIYPHSVIQLHGIQVHVNGSENSILLNANRMRETYRF